MCGRSKSPITILGVAQPEPPADLAPHRRRGGRGERDPHAGAELVRLRAEPQVVRPEVLAPLADEVRLVDDEQSRPARRSAVAGLVVGELLGREEHELVRSAGLDERCRPRPRRLRRVQDRRRQARRAQVGELVVLERDQRRHDDGRPAAQQAGELVDRRLPAAGRQHREHVPPGGTPRRPPAPGPAAAARTRAASAPARGLLATRARQPGCPTVGAPSSALDDPLITRPDQGHCAQWRRGSARSRAPRAPRRYAASRATSTRRGRSATTSATGS